MPASQSRVRHNNRTLRDLRWLALDVDGTLTDAKVYYSGSKEMLKRFDMRDGKGLALVRELGVHVLVLTQENSRFTLARAKKLALDDVHLGVHDKRAALERLAGRAQVDLRDVMFVGDDVQDVEAMRATGWSACPGDAHPLAKRAAKYVCRATGGAGAVREVCDLICAAKGHPQYAGWSETGR